MRIDHVLRDRRIGKWLARRWIEDLYRLAVHQSLRKIAFALQSRRHRGEEVVRRVAIGAVVIQEEERLRTAVVNVRNIERTADRSPESLLQISRDSPTARRSEHTVWRSRLRSVRRVVKHAVGLVEVEAAATAAKPTASTRTETSTTGTTPGPKPPPGPPGPPCPPCWFRYS